MKVAIIGAGMTGASAAHWLSEAGAKVHVFDKARGAGGRMTSKRIAEDCYLDMGAQYFTARDPDFKNQVATWQAEGFVAPWQFTPYRYQEALVLSADDECRYVGLPTMQQPVKQLLSAIELTTEFTVTDVKQTEHGTWQLAGAEGLIAQDFDAVLITVPPVQASALLSHFPSLQQQIPLQALKPCWAVVLTLNEAEPHPATGIFVQSGDLRWLCQLQDKPERSQQSQWLLHFSQAFTEQHLTATPEFLTAAATLELTKILATPVKVAHSVCHRWLYATVDATQTAPGIIHDDAYSLWLAGDWSFGGRIENAWLAGRAAAKQLWETLALSRPKRVS